MPELVESVNISVEKMPHSAKSISYNTGHSHKAQSALH